MNYNHEKEFFKTPLKNGVLVMVDPKYRKSEYIDLFNLEIIEPEKKGFNKGATLGDYFQLLESNIAELKKENDDLKIKFNKLIDLIKNINERGL